MLQQCYIHPEDGDGSIHQNVGTASTNDMAGDLRLKLPLPSNVHLQGLTYAGSTHQTFLHKIHTRYIQPTHVTVIVLCPDISLHFDIRTSHRYIKMRALIPVTVTNLLGRN
jgi:hypothetical protein